MNLPLIVPIRWPAEAIWEAVASTLPGFTVEVLPEIDSSNTELMRRFRGGPGIAPRPEPTLLVAEQQTAGRGRLGRVWQSARGDSLTFSLGLPLRPTDWSGLSLVVGISLAESLDPVAVGKTRIGLKWPNDLWICDFRGERKLAGILVETASWEGLRYVVIGVGINIRALDIPVLQVASNEALAHTAPGCLQDLFPELDAPAALMQVLPPLVQAVKAFEQFGFAPFQARFDRRDVLSGRAVQLQDGKNVLQGTAHGVGEDGALLVHTLTGMKEITSSEVSVRPLQGVDRAAALAGRPTC
ncbi:MAG: biotin--[acetyl-CoA-carboxylase] ligase [Polaromonas sp.]|nr:biotin--[acetyl-CoA-carboxylase] ligase [Polaromonas sp.]